MTEAMVPKGESVGGDSAPPERNQRNLRDFPAPKRRYGRLALVVGLSLSDPE
jgi:hypothetical protein